MSCGQSSFLELCWIGLWENITSVVKISECVEKGFPLEYVNLKTSCYGQILVYPNVRSWTLHYHQLRPNMLLQLLY